MDLVLLKCAKCRAKIGSLPNLWTQIGRKYITQAGVAQEEEGGGGGGGRAGALGVEAAGSVRLGDADTLIAGCELREAACGKCHASLGQICIKSPPNHELHEDQIIFRVSSLTLKSDADHRRVAQLKIRNVLKLRDPSAAAPLAQGESPPKPGVAASTLVEKAGGMPGASLDLARVQTDLEAQKREIQRIGATGFQVVSSFETSVARFEQQMKRMSLSIESVRDDQQAGRKDLSALKARVSELQRQPPPAVAAAAAAAASDQHPSTADVARLEAQMQAAEKSVGELRQGYQRARSEAAGLRDELRQAQQQLQQVRDDNAALRADVRAAHELAREGVDASRLCAAEVASLRREVQQLRADQLASSALQAPPPPPPPPARSSLPPDDDGYGYGYDASSFFQTHSHELDILASNIAKIGHRASQIESLQMEFQLFRTRVQRLEAKSGNCTPARSEYGSAMGAAEQQQLHGTTSLQRYQHPGGMRVGSSTHRKRPSMSGDDPLSLDPTPSKRVAIASSQTVGLSSDRAGAGEEEGEEEERGIHDDREQRQQPSSPPALRAQDHMQRLAKGASVDRARTRRVSGRAKR